MAILHENRTWDPKTKTHVSALETEFTGMVLCPTFHLDTRIMSDVWEPRPFVKVWTGSEVKTVPAGIKAEQDASPEILAEAQAWETAQGIAKLQAQIAWRELAAKKEAERLRNLPEQGKLMRVAKGRKVPVGTVGTVFWIGPSDWGLRVGLALDDEKDDRGRAKNVAWIAASNLVAA